VHLLTRQAVQLYARKLSPRGVMIFNISNRHLTLEPIMAAIAADMKWKCYIKDDLDVSKAQDESGKTASLWTIMARDKRDVGALLSQPRWRPALANPNIPLWTDDYSSILNVFLWQ